MIICNHCLIPRSILSRVSINVLTSSFVFLSQSNKYSSLDEFINKKEITVNKVKDEKRKIVFRDDNYSVDSKSRFAGIVNEIPLDSDELIKALKDAIKNSQKNSSPKTKTKVVKEEPIVKEEPSVEEIDDIEEELPFEEEPVVESEYPEDLVGEIRKMFKACKEPELKASVKSVISEHGGKLAEVDEDGLKQIYDILK